MAKWDMKLPAQAGDRSGHTTLRGVLAWLVREPRQAVWRDYARHVSCDFS